MAADAAIGEPAVENLSRVTMEYIPSDHSTHLKLLLNGLRKFRKPVIQRCIDNNKVRMVLRREITRKFEQHRGFTQKVVTDGLLADSIVVKADKVD